MRDFNHLKLADQPGGTRASPRLKWTMLFAGAVIAFSLAMTGWLSVETAMPQLPVVAVSTGGIPAKDIQQNAQEPTTVTARVTGITDGDTITVRPQSGEQITVRLTEIDAPEWNQPWGDKAKTALAKLVSGREVNIRTGGTDQYGRTLGRVFVSETDVNAEMIHAGHAWAYRDYLTDTSFLSIETQAREAKRGLWSLPFNDRVAPWDWRHSGNPSRQADNVPKVSFAPEVSSRGMQCRGKRYCREMASCEEARFYLNVCRVDTIDGDFDGKPCEDICGH